MIFGTSMDKATLFKGLEHETHWQLSKQGLSNVRLGNEVEEYVIESGGLGVESSEEYLGSSMWNSNLHWHAQICGWE